MRALWYRQELTCRPCGKDLQAPPWCESARDVRQSGQVSGKLSDRRACVLVEQGLRRTGLVFGPPTLNGNAMSLVGSTKQTPENLYSSSSVSSRDINSRFQSKIIGTYTGNMKFMFTDYCVSLSVISVRDSEWAQIPYMITIHVTFYGI